VNTIISSAILMIVTIIAASIFTAAALQQLYAFQNAFKDVSMRNEEMFSTSITIIGETNKSKSIIIWVKNTGPTSFPLNGTLWDLFITFPNGTYERFNYVSTKSGCSNYCWNATILNDNGNGVWDDGETIQITVYPTSVPSGPYEVRLALPNGVTCDDKFSLG
jgi:archaellum component FlaG (FlaF/FlaG flagellin family)